MLINVKMPTIVGILSFMSRINFMLSSVEYEKSFITSGTSGPCWHAGKSFTICMLGDVACFLSSADFFSFVLILVFIDWYEMLRCVASTVAG